MKKILIVIFLYAMNLYSQNPYFGLKGNFSKNISGIQEVPNFQLKDGMGGAFEVGYQLKKIRLGGVVGFHSFSSSDLTKASEALLEPYKNFNFVNPLQTTQSLKGFSFGLKPEYRFTFGKLGVAPSVLLGAIMLSKREIAYSTQSQILARLGNIPVIKTVSEAQTAMYIEPSLKVTYQLNPKLEMYVSNSFSTFEYKTSMTSINEYRNVNETFSYNEKSETKRINQWNPAIGFTYTFGNTNTTNNDNTRNVPTPFTLDTNSLVNCGGNDLVFSYFNPANSINYDQINVKFICENTNAIIREMNLPLLIGPNSLSIPSLAQSEMPSNCGRIKIVLVPYNLISNVRSLNFSYYLSNCSISTVNCTDDLFSLRINDNIVDERKCYNSPDIIVKNFTNQNVKLNIEIKNSNNQTVFSEYNRTFNSGATYNKLVSTIPYNWENGMEYRVKLEIKNLQGVIICTKNITFSLCCGLNCSNKIDSIVPKITCNNQSAKDSIRMLLDLKVFNTIAQQGIICNATSSSSISQYILSPISNQIKVKFNNNFGLNEIRSFPLNTIIQSGNTFSIPIAIAKNDRIANHLSNLRITPFNFNTTATHTIISNAGSTSCSNTRNADSTVKTILSSNLATCICCNLKIDTIETKKIPFFVESLVTRLRVNNYSTKMMKSFEIAINKMDYFSNMPTLVRHSQTLHTPVNGFFASLNYLFCQNKKMGMLYFNGTNDVLLAGMIGSNGGSFCSMEYTGLNANLLSAASASGGSEISFITLVPPFVSKIYFTLKVYYTDGTYCETKNTVNVPPNTTGGTPRAKVNTTFLNEEESFEAEIQKLKSKYKTEKLFKDNYFKDLYKSSK
jgi:hypothetical protein